ncbi:sporulation protein YpjB [Salibacterium aidingense]|uniref:sporulation protein YpjB n=1 Tax=Salibacterium aidingense TaxID=384933 RepID=UPI000408C192|nr:sporulation protein YpjB [Salibacterium aidingense]
MKTKSITSNIKGRRSVLIICVAAALFLIHIGQTMAEDDDTISMETVNDKAKTMHDLVLNGEYEEAKRIHGWLVRRFPAVSFDDYNLTTRQLTEIFRAFDRAGEAVTNVDMDERQRVQYIFSFRLAVDASISEKHPLWKKSGEQLLLLLDEIKQTLEQEDEQQARQLFYHWQKEFEVIRPALYTGKEEEEYMPLVSYVRYMEKEGWDKSDKISEVEKLKEHLQQAMGKTQNSAADPSLWTIILSIGSVLFVSLTYTGWKKYKGEKERHQMRD